MLWFRPASVVLSPSVGAESAAESARVCLLFDLQFDSVRLSYTYLFVFPAETPRDEGWRWVWICIGFWECCFCIAFLHSSSAHAKRTERLITGDGTLFLGLRIFPNTCSLLFSFFPFFILFLFPCFLFYLLCCCCWFCSCFSFSSPPPPSPPPSILLEREHECNYYSCRVNDMLVHPDKMNQYLYVQEKRQTIPRDKLNTSVNNISINQVFKQDITWT